MIKKNWILSLMVTFVIVTFVSYIVENTNVSFDRVSKFKSRIPEFMRVAHIKNKSEKDFYDNIYISSEKVPDVKDDEVLVYVKSATFTQRDYDFFKINKNTKQFVPCSDFSGFVVKVGKKVKTYEVGDPVFGITDLKNNKGACADYISVPQNNIYLKPYSLTFKQAAAIPTPALLDWFAVHNLQKNGLSKGSVLIDDAISEVGIMLTGLLTKSGFEVTAVDDESVESWLGSFGVKDFISNSSFFEKQKYLANKYDVVINLRHGLPISSLIKLVKPKGTFISYEKTRQNRNDIRMLIIDNTKIDKKIFAKMARLVHLGKLQIKVAKQFNLDHIRDAYVRAIKGNTNGKVIVNVNE